MPAPSLQGRRVLVVGINYEPEHTGIAPYTTQACSYLAAQGADVFVLAGVPHYPHWTTPQEYRRRLFVDEERHGVRVRRLRHVVPGRQSALTRGAYELTYGMHVSAQVPPWRPDVVLAVIPSLAGAAAAARLARKADVPLVVWVQDLMGPAAAQSGIRGGASISVLTARLEGHVLRNASSVLVLNEAFKRYAVGVGVASRSVHVVPNWTHLAATTGDRQLMRKRQGWRHDQVIVLHSGNMGLKQGLVNVIRAARLAAEEAPKVRFVLMGDGSQRVALQDLGTGVPTLSFLPAASARDYPNLLAAADVLLVNERASAVDMSLPSKLTSYFRAGMPVIAAVPSFGGTAQEIAQSGAGVVVEPDSPRALFEGVRKLSMDKELLYTLGASASAYAATHLDATSSLESLAVLLAPPSQ